jgi:hypothetical protein
MKAWIAAAALLLSAPLAAQQDITAAGPVAHRSAGTSFPERVGDLERAQVVRYGENDISANYDLQRGADRLRLSVYVYPAPAVPAAERAAACRAEMDMVGQSIARHHPGAEPIESGEAAAMPGTAPALRLRTVHNIELALRNPKPEAVRSEARLYCFVAGNWLVKYRASSNAGFDVGPIIDDFVRLGPWPGRRPGEIAFR